MYFKYVYLMSSVVICKLLNIINNTIINMHIFSCLLIPDLLKQLQVIY